MNRLASPILCALVLTCVASRALAVTVDVLTVNGEAFRADWVGLDEDGSFRFLVDGKPQIRPQRELMEIVPVTKAPATAPDAGPHQYGCDPIAPFPQGR